VCGYSKQQEKDRKRLGREKKKREKKEKRRGRKLLLLRGRLLLRHWQQLRRNKES